MTVRPPLVTPPLLSSTASLYGTDLSIPNEGITHFYIPNSILTLATLTSGTNHQQIQAGLDKNKAFESMIQETPLAKQSLFERFPQIQLFIDKVFTGTKKQEAPTLPLGANGIARVILDANGSNDPKKTTLGRYEGQGPTGNPDYDLLHDTMGQAIDAAQAILKQQFDVAKAILQPGVENPIQLMKGELTSTVNVDPTPDDSNGYIQGAYTYNGKDILNYNELGSFIYGAILSHERSFFNQPNQTKSVPRHEIGHLLTRFINPVFFMMISGNPEGESFGDCFAQHLKQKHDWEAPLPLKGEPGAHDAWMLGGDFLVNQEGTSLGLRHFYGMARPEGYNHPYLGPYIGRADSLTLSPTELGSDYLDALFVDKEHLKSDQYNYNFYLQVEADDGHTTNAMTTKALGSMLRRPEFLDDPIPNPFRTAYYNYLAANLLVDLGMIEDKNWPEIVRQSWEKQGIDATIKPKSIQQVMSGKKEQFSAHFLNLMA